jgi:predicted nucleotidyltransferase
MKIRISNETLNPVLWNKDGTMKPEVRQALLKIAQDFYVNTKLKAPIKDICIVGSAVNYNWNSTSDIDLHIIIDFRQLSNDLILAKQTVDAIKSNWNKNHNITIKNHKIELYIQDITEKNRSKGIFSIFTNQWKQYPVKPNLVLNKELIQKMYNDILQQIKMAMDSKDYDVLKNVLKYIYDLREVGLSREGDYSTENLVFKILRSRGHLDALKKTIDAVYDQNISIKQEHH